jgi:REP element-mobilizing transposase RayT
MPQSLAKIYIHIIFSTKHRKNLIDDDIEEPLFEYIGGICKRLETNPVIVGGYRNHVHILCMLSRKVTVMHLVQEIKRASSKWIKTKGAKYSNFYWQDGYAVFSVYAKTLNIVENYIKNQRTHHTRVKYKREFRSLMKEIDMEYNEQYIWE